MAQLHNAAPFLIVSQSPSPQGGWWNLLYPSDENIKAQTQGHLSELCSLPQKG